jgi:hypothetical protein
VGLGWFGWAMGQDHSDQMKALCERANRLGSMQVDVAPKDNSTGALRFFHLATRCAICTATSATAWWY